MPSDTLFDLYLTGFDPARKIQIIQAVREITGIGLKEAKDLVENAPQPIRQGIAREAADTLGARLRDAGGQVEICPQGAQPSIPVRPLPPPTTATGCATLLLVGIGLCIALVVIPW